MKTAFVILAAGEGTRMKSALPKVLHTLCGRTMLGAVVDSVRRVKPQKIVVVAGRHIDRIREAVGADDILFAMQDKPLGTGHAVRASLPALKGFRGDVLVMNGDTPLVRPETVRRFIKMHRQKKAGLSVLSFVAADPGAYGRIVRDRNGQFVSIVEEKDAAPEQKNIAEVNSGMYVIGPEALRLLDCIPVNSAKGEYFLTDIVSIAAHKGLKTSAFCIGIEEEFMGVNTRPELLRAAALMRRNLIAEFSAGGVDFIDAERVYPDFGIKIGTGAVIYPNVYLQGNTVIGAGTVIYPNVRIKDSRIGKDAVIKDSTVIEESEVKERASVGPFAHLRPGSVIGPEAKIGNFVEIKKSVIGRASKASHLSYIGDAAVGAGVNIGAGTITCNYDGLNKHRTIIEDGVFIGSDSQLVAPVKIGRGAYVGAGSTITRDVPAEALAISRVRQTHLEGWARKKKKK